MKNAIFFSFAATAAAVSVATEADLDLQISLDSNSSPDVKRQIEQAMRLKEAAEAEKAPFSKKVKNFLEAPFAKKTYNFNMTSQDLRMIAAREEKSQRAAYEKYAAEHQGGGERKKIKGMAVRLQEKNEKPLDEDDQAFQAAVNLVVGGQHKDEVRFKIQ